MHCAVAEGVPTARAAHELAVRLGVECPVLQGIYRVVHGESVVSGLMTAAVVQPAV